MLPGEAHPSEDLDAPLGALHVGVEHKGPGQDGRQPGLGGLARIGGVGRVPGQSGDLLDGDEHVGQPVLDRLELADGPSELAAVAGVLGAHLETPPRPTGALRCCHHERQVAHHGVRRPGQATLRGEGHALHLHPPHPPGGVEAGEGFDAHTGGVEVEHPPLHRRRPCARGGHRHRGHQAPGERHGQHGDHLAPKLQPAVGGRCPGQGGGGGQGHGGGARAVHERGEQGLALVLGGPGAHHGGRQHGGHDRPRHHGPRHLLDHHGQLQETEALAAVLLGHVDAEPSLGGELVPERRGRLRLGVEQGPGHLGGTARTRASGGPCGAAPRGPHRCRWALPASSPVRTTRWRGRSTTTAPRGGRGPPPPPAPS